LSAIEAVERCFTDPTSPPSLDITTTGTWIHRATQLTEVIPMVQFESVTYGSPDPGKRSIRAFPQEIARITCRNEELRSNHGKAQPGRALAGLSQPLACVSILMDAALVRPDGFNRIPNSLKWVARGYSHGQANRG